MTYPFHHASPLTMLSHTRALLHPRLSRPPPPARRAIFSNAQQLLDLHEGSLAPTTACNTGCNHVQPRLQPCVTQAATVCDPGCNRMYCRLQPYVLQGAAVCTAGCNRMYCRLQPYVL